MDVTARARGVWQSAGSRLRGAIFRALGMKLAGTAWIQAIEWPARPRTIFLGEGAALDRGVTLLATSDSARIVIGASVYINRCTIIDTEDLVEIGAETMIGPFCYLTDHDHTFAKNTAPGAGPLISRPTRIGARCWLGAHVTVLKGVTIGDGAVIGAGSVVTKSVPPGTVAVGNPARVLREVST